MTLGNVYDRNKQQWFRVFFTAADAEEWVKEVIHDDKDADYGEVIEEDGTYHHIDRYTLKGVR